MAAARALPRGRRVHRAGRVHGSPTAAPRLHVRHRRVLHCGRHGHAGRGGREHQGGHPLQTDAGRTSRADRYHHVRHEPAFLQPEREFEPAADVCCLRLGGPLPATARRHLGPHVRKRSVDFEPPRLFDGGLQGYQGERVVPGLGGEGRLPGDEARRRQDPVLRRLHPQRRRALPEVHAGQPSPRGHGPRGGAPATRERRVQGSRRGAHEGADLR
mmetsp:Transcript_48521/g.128187  ORF Transcript_48521/g.128187 Transcript_48521/m.128187 type:complete len:215 (-) Transcript_48521:106-750(-)